MKLVNLWIDDSHPFWQEWAAKAIELGVEYGILIEAEKKWLNDGHELYYQIDQHKFGSLKDLRKALEMKTLL
jgi:hypothetical protein